MNRIVEILMEREGLTQQEAREQMQEAKEMMEHCNFNPSECEDIMMEGLGLEPDYFFDLLL